MAKKLQADDAPLPPDSNHNYSRNEELAQDYPNSKTAQLMASDAAPVPRKRIVYGSPATRAISRIEAILRELTPEQSARVLRFVADGAAERMHQLALPFVPAENQ
jgi:hypothetical protein